MKNFFKTAFFLTLLTLLLVWLGAAVGGRQGVIISFVFACIINFGAYWFSDKIVLAIYRAKPVSREEAPQLYATVEKLTASANIPMPKIYIIPTHTPNAFATGRDPSHAAVAVTEGIMGMLSEDELEGVLAHELAHVKNRDILTQTIVATIAGAISMIAYMVRWGAMFGGIGGRGGDRRDSGNAIGLLAMAIIAPIAAMLIQLAISRAREYQADASGAHICKRPLSLAHALAKLQNANQRIPMDANPNTAHMFIVNPLSGKGFLTLFSTHPPLENRIAKLESMAK
jgi:heat shock protein HtpX